MNRPRLAHSRLAALALLLTLGVVGITAKDDPKTKSIELPEDNAVAKLKPGAGMETAEANCIVCHSTDYMVRQPGGDAQRWLEVVNKMVKVYGASVSDEDAKIIANYLAGAYPPEPAKPGAKSGTASETVKAKKQSRPAH